MVCFWGPDGSFQCCLSSSHPVYVFWRQGLTVGDLTNEVRGAGGPGRLLSAFARCWDYRRVPPSLALDFTWVRGTELAVSSVSVASPSYFGNGDLERADELQERGYFS